MKPALGAWRRALGKGQFDHVDDVKDRVRSDGRENIVGVFVKHGESGAENRERHKDRPTAVDGAKDERGAPNRELGEAEPPDRRKQNAAKQEFLAQRCQGDGENDEATVIKRVMRVLKYFDRLLFDGGLAGDAVVLVDGSPFQEAADGQKNNRGEDAPKKRAVDAPARNAEGFFPVKLAPPQDKTGGGHNGHLRS